MIIFNRILAACNILLFAALAWLIIAQGLPLRPSAGWEYKDLISALLTAVTIILAFIGLVVALAAVWGWQTISQGAAREAAKASAQHTDDHLQSPSFQSKLRLLILEQVENMKKSAVQDEVVVEQGEAQPQNQAAPAADEEWQD